MPIAANPAAASAAADAWSQALGSSSGSPGRCRSANALIVQAPSTSARACASPGQRRGPAPNGQSGEVDDDDLARRAPTRRVTGTGVSSPRTSAAVASHACTSSVTRAATIGSPPGRSARRCASAASAPGCDGVAGGRRRRRRARRRRRRAARRRRAPREHRDAGRTRERRRAMRHELDVARSAAAAARSAAEVGAQQAGLDERAAAGVRLALGEARDGRAQPGHRAERARRAGGGDAGRRAACADDTRATFRCSPKRRGPSLQDMSEIADVAAALADRTRARMLEELLGGPPLPAGALAVRVGVAPSTVSGHLRKLERAGLITIESHGRRREARLAGPARRGGARGARESAGDDDRPIGLTRGQPQAGAARGALVLRPPRGPRGRRARRRAARPRRARQRDGAFVLADARYFRERFGVRPEAAIQHPPPARARVHRLDRAPPACRRRARRRRCWTRCCARRSLQRRPDGRALNVTRATSCSTTVAATAA